MSFSSQILGWLTGPWVVVGIAVLLIFVYGKKKFIPTEVITKWALGVLFGYFGGDLFVKTFFYFQLNDSGMHSAIFSILGAAIVTSAFFYKNRTISPDIPGSKLSALSVTMPIKFRLIWLSLPVISAAATVIWVRQQGEGLLGLIVLLPVAGFLSVAFVLMLIGAQTKKSTLRVVLLSIGTFISLIPLWPLWFTLLDRIF